MSREQDKKVSQRMLEQSLRNLEKWGLQDLKTLALAISEECGELCQAVLQYHDEKGDINRIKEEAIDLGALLFQIIERVSYDEVFGKDLACGHSNKEKKGEGQ